MEREVKEMEAMKEEVKTTTSHNHGGARPKTSSTRYSQSSNNQQNPWHRKSNGAAGQKGRFLNNVLCDSLNCTLQ